ncbi:MAG: MGMT family protein, partial [Candidatus Altiarchaeota archaeon]|nr:MGMT family protein [Candidatus Altiarchaeota archaeon]
AVGQALKKNPVPVIIPCHRIVSSNGIGGFSCGLRLKKKLLRMEGAIA